MTARSRRVPRVRARLPRVWQHSYFVDSSLGNSGRFFHRNSGGLTLDGAQQFSEGGKTEFDALGPSPLAVRTDKVGVRIRGSESIMCRIRDAAYPPPGSNHWSPSFLEVVLSPEGDYSEVELRYPITDFFPSRESIPYHPVLIPVRLWGKDNDAGCDVESLTLRLRISEPLLSVLNKLESKCYGEIKPAPGPDDEFAELTVFVIGSEIRKLR